MRATAVASTTLAAVDYDPSAQMLWLEFRSGAVYRYCDVPLAVYQSLLTAPSKGAYFNRHIRGRFEYHRQLDSDTRGADSARS
jgi:KTSC domain